MKVYIRNMVAQGTRKFVLMEVKKLGLKLTAFESSELEFQDELTTEASAALEKSLSKYGLELVNENTITENQLELYKVDNSFIYDEDEIELSGVMEPAETMQIE